MIRNSSLNQSNIIFVFREGTPIPENKDFMGMFEGVNAQGMNFVDDPVSLTKVVTVPKLGLSVAWEGRRLRIEDLQQKEPKESSIVRDALSAFHKLFPGQQSGLEGFGFNFNVYYQMRDVIRIHELFGNLYPTGLALGDSLMDFGWQWTLARKDGARLDGYYVKITAPIELAVHHNAHVKATNIPTLEDMEEMFSGAYTETQETIEKLVL